MLVTPPSGTPQRPVAVPSLVISPSVTPQQAVAPLEEILDMLAQLHLSIAVQVLRGTAHPVHIGYTQAFLPLPLTC